MSLTWRDNATTETGFAVERCTGAGCTNFVQIASVGPRNNVGNVTYVDATVTFGNDYVYRVAAASGAGLSAYSNNAPASVPAIPAVPTSFTSIASATAVNGPNTTVALAWVADTAGVSSFTIQRATNLEFTLGLNTVTAAGTATSLTQTVRDNTTYYYRIRANNSAGGSSAWKNAQPFPVRTGR